MIQLETVSEMRNPTAHPVSASSPFSARSAYVHVPFCTARCRYCAFYSGEPLDRVPRFLPALEREIEAWGPGAGPLDTVYLGGGTPGLLGAEGLTRILDALRGVRGIAPDAEITIEVNPGAGPDPGALRSAGATRVSVGVQALDDRWLQTLGRRHGAAQALAYLSAARAAGVRSVSADLLIGLPGLAPRTLAGWARDCVRAGADHVSVYVLELHEGTPLRRATEAGRFPWPAPDEAAGQWEAVAEALAAEGLHPYEVSNFARPGGECRHNLAYWDGKGYRGLGPGAHSFDPDLGPWGIRWENRPDLEGWLRALQAGAPPPRSVDERSAEGALLEALFLWARRPVPWPADVLRRHGLEPRRAEPLLEVLRRGGDLDRRNRPTPQGMLRADGLALWLWERLVADTGRGNSEEGDQAG